MVLDVQDLLWNLCGRFNAQSQKNYDTGLLWCIRTPHHMAILKHKCSWTRWRTLLTKWYTDCGNIEGHLKLFFIRLCIHLISLSPIFSTGSLLYKRWLCAKIPKSRIGPGKTFSCFCLHMLTVQCSWDVSNSVATGRCSWLLWRRQHPCCSQIEAPL